MRNDNVAEVKLDANQLSINGVLDFNSVPSLYKQCVKLIAPLTSFNIDLSGVSHSNSAGIALLLELTRHARQMKKAIHFSQLPAQLLSIAKSSDLEPILQRLSSN